MGQRGNLQGNLKYIKLSKNKDATYQNMWDVAKAVLNGKFITLDAYMKMKEVSNQVFMEMSPVLGAGVTVGLTSTQGAIPWRSSS